MPTREDGNLGKCFVFLDSSLFVLRFFLHFVLSLVLSLLFNPLLDAMFPPCAPFCPHRALEHAFELALSTLWSTLHAVLPIVEDPHVSYHNKSNLKSKALWKAPMHTWHKIFQSDLSNHVGFVLQMDVDVSITTACLHTHS